MTTIKVLELCSRLDIGGAQAVAANIALRAPQEFQFDYLVFGDRVGDYEAELTQKGCRILHWAPPSSGQALFVKKLTDHLRREHYTAVHCHNLFHCGSVMLAARLAGVPCRISHSHTTKEDCTVTLTRRIYRGLMRTLIHLCGNEFFACGTAAGHMLYGRRWFDARGTLIPNGIDTAVYRFSPENRKHIRAQYALEGRYVIGHVGHYTGVKNQSFLIRLMPRLLTERPDAVLLLFGEGEDREMLTDLIRELGLQDHVRLMGNVRNIGQILSALDVFAFPSLFEGTPLALLEAQANGLPCLISENIPSDACLTEDVRRLPLEPGLWIPALKDARRVAPLDRSGLLLQRYEDIQTSMDRIYRVIQTYHTER